MKKDEIQKLIGKTFDSILTKEICKLERIEQVGENYIAWLDLMDKYGFASGNMYHTEINKFELKFKLRNSNKKF